MRKLIFVFSIVVSVCGMAEPEDKTVFSCLTLNVSDAGYDVRIVGVPRRLEARVYENSYLGPKFLQSYPVKMRNRRDGIDFLDRSTGGKNFNLLMRINSGHNLVGSYPASFKAIVNGTVIPPKQFPEFGELTCWEHQN